MGVAGPSKNFEIFCCMTAIISYDTHHAKEICGRNQDRSRLRKVITMRYEKGHKEATRQKIVEVAAAEFRRNGIEGIGVADLHGQGRPDARRFLQPFQVEGRTRPGRDGRSPRRRADFASSPRKAEASTRSSACICGLRRATSPSAAAPSRPSSRKSAGIRWTHARGLTASVERLVGVIETRLPETWRTAARRPSVSSRR